MNTNLVGSLLSPRSVPVTSINGGNQIKSEGKVVVVSYGGGVLQIRKAEKSSKPYPGRYLVEDFKPA